MNAEILTDLLEIEGISVEWTQNGQTAVDLETLSKALTTVELKLPFKE